MNKLWLIVKREYTTRVFKKSFILLTLLVPIGIIFFSVMVGFIMSKNTVTNLKVAVSDPQHMTTDSLFSTSKSINYTYTNLSFEELKKEMESGKYQAVVELVPPSDLKQIDFKIKIHTDEKLDINTSSSIAFKVIKLYSSTSFCFVYSLNNL